MYVLVLFYIGQIFGMPVNLCENVVPPDQKEILDLIESNLT